MAWHKPTNLQEWMGIILRHKKKFFFPALLVATVVIFASNWYPREYFAEAKFQRVNDATLNTIGGGINTQNLYTIRRQLNEDIKGRSAIEQLMADLELTRNPSRSSSEQLTKEEQLANLETINRLNRSINVWFQVQSDQVDQIVVNINDQDPILAPKIVNRVVENYINKTRQQLNEMLLNAKVFFEREVARYRARVTEMESKKLRFELDNPGLAPNDPASIQSRLVELRTKLDNANQDLSVSTQKRIRLKDLLAQQPEFLEHRQRGANPLLTNLLSKKSAVETELEQHRAIGRTDEHPLVIKAKTRIADLDKQIKATEPEVESVTELQPNTARIALAQEIESLSGTIIALEKQRQDLDGQVERYEVMNRNFFVVRNEYLRIQRELNEATSQLNFWENNLHRTTIALTAEVGSRGVRLSFLQRASDYAKPTKPTLWGIVSLALIAGLGVGVACIFIAELLDQSFHSVDQAVENLKLPVLGAVNEIVTPSAVFRQRVLAWGVYPAVALACLIVLLVSLAMTYMSLENPARFDQITSSPTRFLKQAFLGS